MTSEFDVVMEIQKEAESCRQDFEDENAWRYRVVRPLLERALHKPESSVWTVEWV